MNMNEDGGTFYQALFYVPSKRKCACTGWLLFYHASFGQWLAETCHEQWSQNGMICKIYFRQSTFAMYSRSPDTNGKIHDRSRFANAASHSKFMSHNSLRFDDLSISILAIRKHKR